MIRTLKVLFCDNEHGCGDITFPETRDIADATIVNHGAATVKQLRREARAAGWKRKGEQDLCPMCVECEEGR